MICPYSPFLLEQKQTWDKWFWASDSNLSRDFVDSAFLVTYLSAWLNTVLVFALNANGSLHFSNHTELGLLVHDINPIPDQVFAVAPKESGNMEEKRKSNRAQRNEKPDFRERWALLHTMLPCSPCSYLLVLTHPISPAVAEGFWESSSNTNFMLKWRNQQNYSTSAEKALVKQVCVAFQLVMYYSLRASLILWNSRNAWFGLLQFR